MTSAVESWSGHHYKVFGNLIVPAGRRLEIQDSLVEIVSEYARQHQVAIQGGTVSTLDTTIGGTSRAGTFVQTISPSIASSP